MGCDINYGAKMINHKDVLPEYVPQLVTRVDGEYIQDSPFVVENGKVVLRLFSMPAKPFEKLEILYEGECFVEWNVNPDFEWPEFIEGDSFYLDFKKCCKG